MLEFLTVVAPVLAMASILLMAVDFKLGEKKWYRFALGELTYLAALAFAIQVALDVSWLAPYAVAIWFFIGSLNFARATWSK